MDLNTLLQGYRVKYGLETEQAKESDPFANSFETAPAQGGSEWMPMDESVEKQTLSSTNTMQDQQAMKEFFAMADKNPILSRKLDERDAALMEINAMLRDPSNPMDENMAMSLVDEIELNLDKED